MSDGVLDGCLHEHGLRIGVDLSGNEINLGVGDNLALAIEQLHFLSHLQILRTLDGNIDVDLERARLIDGGEGGRGGHAIAHAHGNVANESVGGSIHAIVVQLRLLLLDLRVERFELVLGCFEVGARLIVILLAGYTGIEEFLRALPLNLREMNVRFLSGAGSFLASQGGLLLDWVNLHERGSGFHAVARSHENIRDLPLDLGIQDDRMAGLEGSQVFRRFGDRHRLNDGRLDRNGGRLLVTSGLLLSAARDHRREAHDGEQRAQSDFRREMRALAYR